MFRAIDRWLAGYLVSALSRPRSWPKPAHVIFCLADHFEPFWGGADPDRALARVARWRAGYPRAFAEFRDADGKPPRHTFFYPQEEYHEGCIEDLAGLCRDGWGEVEIQVHHRNDTADGLADKLERFRDTLSVRHGLLGSDRAGHVRYGFVHGNWALCNSRPDGDWCGVNEELRVLDGTGCYADFTFPSAPSPTQPRMVNLIYRASDRAGAPRGHDRGTPVRAGGARTAREGTVMLVTGPLGLDFGRRKWGIFPRLENGAIDRANPASARRADLWVRRHICLGGRPDWVFVKAHTHGCQEANMESLLGAPMRALHGHLARRYNDGCDWILHYATAREMYNIVRAAEDGLAGNPGEYRDYELRRGES